MQVNDELYREIMKYIKRAIVIEAFRYSFDKEPEWSLKSTSVNHCQTRNDMWLEIKTLEGIMKAIPGDYIIKGIQGEIYPCKADIFKNSYDKYQE
jgi:hypothetical protein